MKKIRKKSPARLFHIISGLFLVISILVLFTLGVSVQYQDLRETYALAEETVDFLKTECKKFDGYSQGIASSALQDLLDTAIGLRDFIQDSDLTDDTFLKKFIRTEHVGGVLVLDENFSLLAQADLDDKDSLSLWSDVLKKTGVKEILQHPQKRYVDHTDIEGVPYDFAVTASKEKGRLILCYASNQKPDTDPYELTIGSVLTNNSFHKNPTVLITDGTKVLSTNNSVVEKVGTEEYARLSASIAWKEGQLTRFQYKGETWYGLRHVYNNYFMYAVYSEAEVFSNRTNFIALAFMIYLVFCLVILFVQRYFDKTNLRKLQKQLRIIDAISTSYASTFLMHLDRKELEPVRPSRILKQIYEKHPEPEAFLDCVCGEQVAPEYQKSLLHFLDTGTMAARLVGQPYLGQEIRDGEGSWYSVLLIPQRYDEKQQIQAVLVTTRNITAIKQAEELSFKDRLTGLYNRNYMEAEGEKLLQEGTFPVSFIMADCNYLKRTNDTLGHEYGDLLLKGVAESIQAVLPEHAVAMRVGGDEFLILCPYFPHEKADDLVASIRRKLAEKSRADLPLSVSFGVYTAENEKISFKEAYEQADQAMYQDKQRSRAGRE